MSDPLFFLIIFIAIASGFGLGIVAGRKPSRQHSHLASRPQQRYIKSIAHLLAEESDTAIETFISDLDVTSDTIETHLALGNLLRNRGEVSRAIRIHQNLIARPRLSRQEQDLSQYELAVDFIRAGLLDRAESLLRELAEAKNADKNIRNKSLERLVEIYIDTADWVKAIDIADRLTSSKFASLPDSWRELQSQLCCELAHESIAKKDWMSARRWLRDALRFDKRCVRASLLQAELDMSEGAYAAALVVLRKIPRQTPSLTSEALPPMMACFKALDSRPEMLNELKTIYAESGDFVALCCLSRELEDDQEVIKLLLQDLPKFSQYHHLNGLLSILQERMVDTKSEATMSLKAALLSLMEQTAGYLCEACGFEGQQMHWLCPSCKKWGTITHL